MHVTTYKCRQTIAEVQSSYSVNQDTRQTCEKKTDCQAKNVKMQTTASQNKQSSGCLRGDHLPKVLKYNHETKEPPGDTSHFNFKYFTLFKCHDFLSDPIHRLFKVEGRKKRYARSCGCKSASLPQAHSGSYSAGGLVAAGGDGDGELETIRHDSVRLVGMFQASVCRYVAECVINKEGE